LVNIHPLNLKLKKDLRTGDAIAPLLFNIVLEIAIRRYEVLYSFFWVNSPASEFYKPTFRNTLSVPSPQVM
jgi:hypothetical protein